MTGDKQRRSSRLRLGMYKLFVAAVIALSIQHLPAGNPLTLEVYCISSEPKPGWRYFNSSAFPNLGYVAAQPDMSVSQIKNVSIEKTTETSTIIHRDGSRKTTKEEVPSLIIEFTADDARKFRELTGTHLNQRVLWLLGNEALFAPIIRMPIEEPSVAISVRPGVDAETIKAQLEKLREH